MNLKLRITLWFTLIVTTILLGSFYIAYQNYSAFRKSNFYERLNDRARFVADNYYESEFLHEHHLQQLNDYNLGVAPILQVSFYTQNGKFLKAIGDTLPFDKSIINQLSNVNNIEKEQNDTQFVYFQLQQSQIPIFVIASAYDKVGYSKVDFLRNMFIAIWLIAILTTAIAGWWFAKLSLTPIMQIVTKVKKITALNLHTRIKEYTTKDEIATLANTFNQMLDRLESSFALQKNFVANASHEFRTPLTALKGQIQVALLKQRSSQEYEVLLKSLNEDINNIINLLNALQQLAKANADFTSHAFHKIPLLDVLVEARNELLRNKPTYKVELSIIPNEDDGSDSFYFMGDINLMKSAFGNLMDNGCKFSPDLSVTITLRLDKNNFILQFADGGVGIAPESLINIFEPFFRANDIRHIYGHGIGLSLVKRIIEIHKGTINVISELGKGTTFTLSIPTASSL